MDSQASSDRGSMTQVSTAHAVPRFGEVAASALRYWEPRRILYNLALTCVVLAHFITAWPASRAFVTWNVFFLLIILAVLANVCYCAAYVVDIFVQYSAIRAVWPRWRWMLLLVGMVFGAVIAHFFSMGMLSAGGPD